MTSIFKVHLKNGKETITHYSLCTSLPCFFFFFYLLDSSQSPCQVLLKYLSLSIVCHSLMSFLKRLANFVSDIVTSINLHSCHGENYFLKTSAFLPGLFEALIAYNVTWSLNFLHNFSFERNGMEYEEHFFHETLLHMFWKFIWQTFLQGMEILYWQSLLNYSLIFQNVVDYNTTLSSGYCTDFETKLAYIDGLHLLFL